MTVLAMNLTQKKILSVFLILIFSVAIYLLVKFAIRNFKKIKKTNMLTLNMTIRYKTFIEFVEYQRKNQADYMLFLVSVNNFNQLKRQHTPRVIGTYLKKVAKNLSMYLPYGGKLAQTKQRETFVIYIPSSSIDALEYAETLKNAASEVFIVDGKYIQKAISVCYVTEKSETLEKQFEKLSYALVESKRRLTKIIRYEDDVISSIEDYNQIYNSLDNVLIQANRYEVYGVKAKFSKETYVKFLLEGDKINTFIKKVSKKDQSWVNMWLIELLLSSYQINDIEGTITIPVTIQALEEEYFNSALSQIVYFNQFNPSEVIISLIDAGSTNLQLAIKNLLELKNLGFKLSYQIQSIDSSVYQIIQSYHVERLELTDVLFSQKTNELDELLYFAKVNHLDMLVKTEKENITSYLDENISHVLKKINKKFILNDLEKKSGLYK